MIEIAEDQMCRCACVTFAQRDRAFHKTTPVQQIAQLIILGDEAEDMILILDDIQRLL